MTAKSSVIPKALLVTELMTAIKGNTKQKKMID